MWSIDQKFENIHCIKPIISANIQKLNMWKVNNEAWKTKTNQFDFTIIDEAAQTSSKFIPYLVTISKKIIAVGDEIQLSPIENDEVNQNIELLKQKFGEKEIEKLNDLLTKSTNLFIKKNNKLIFKYNSLLEWINENSNTISTITTSENSYLKRSGFFILEHFRCPYQIFSLVNKYFYNNGLTFAKVFEEDKCNLSKLISSDLTCDESSLIQIKYDNKSNYKNLNIKELEIGFNFIIDNIKIFLNHKINQKSIKVGKEESEYLKNNVAFVTLYKNQSDLMKEIIKKITSKLNNENSKENIDFKEETFKTIDYIYKKIKKNFDNTEQKYIMDFLLNFKCGTVDSLQGIGCDFIIFSNVNNHYKNDKNMIRTFEFDTNRINVLWTRTKKHFIHIISNNYWKNISDNEMEQLEFRFESEISSDKLNISRIVFDIKDNNILDFSIENLLVKYKKFDSIEKQISEIGKYGELVFDKISRDQSFSKLLAKKINDEIGINLSFENNIKWENQNKEKYLEWDFIIDNHYIDVKASKKFNSNKLIISKNEWKFGIENKEKYFIAKINDITKFNININNQSSKAFILNNISFYKYEKNILKNINNSIYYIFREEL